MRVEVMCFLVRSTDSVRVPQEPNPDQQIHPGSSRLGEDSHKGLAVAIAAWQELRAISSTHRVAQEVPALLTECRWAH